MMFKGCTILQSGTSVSIWLNQAILAVRIVEASIGMVFFIVFEENLHLTLR